VNGGGGGGGFSNLNLIYVVFGGKRNYNSQIFVLFIYGPGGFHDPINVPWVFGIHPVRTSSTRYTGWQ
jgi:hypothetical protein